MASQLNLLYGAKKRKSKERNKKTNRYSWEDAVWVIVGGMSADSERESMVRRICETDRREGVRDDRWWEW